MYRKIENQRMTDIEASLYYPDDYIVMRMDSTDLANAVGTVLYVGDNRRELYSLINQLKDQTNCGVLEGLNIQQSLGGVAVGG